MILVDGKFGQTLPIEMPIGPHGLCRAQAELANYWLFQNYLQVIDYIYYLNV